MIGITIGEIPHKRGSSSNCPPRHWEVQPRCTHHYDFPQSEFCFRHYLKEFADKLGIELNPGDVEQ